ncbi:hypothetical protein HK096_004440, partial [Nowakowskiella sp. JEL0078]
MDPLNASSGSQSVIVAPKRSSSLDNYFRDMPSTIEDLESRFNTNMKDSPTFCISPVRIVHFENPNPNEYSEKVEDLQIPIYIPPRIVHHTPLSTDPPRSLSQANIYSDADTHNNSASQTNSPVNNTFNNQVTSNAPNLSSNVILPPMTNTLPQRATTPRKRPRLPPLYIPRKPNFDEILPEHSQSDTTNINVLPHFINPNPHTESHSRPKNADPRVFSKITKSNSTPHKSNHSHDYSTPQLFDTVINPQVDMNKHMPDRVAALVDSIVLDMTDDEVIMKREKKIKVWFKRVFGSVYPPIAIGLTLLLINVLVLDTLVL